MSLSLWKHSVTTSTFVLFEMTFEKARFYSSRVDGLTHTLTEMHLLIWILMEYSSWRRTYHTATAHLIKHDSASASQVYGNPMARLKKLMSWTGVSGKRRLFLTNRILKPSLAAFLGHMRLYQNLAVACHSYAVHMGNVIVTLFTKSSILLIARAIRGRSLLSASCAVM